MIFPIRNMILAIAPAPAPEPILPVTLPSPSHLRLKRVPSPLTDSCRLPEDKQANAMECGASRIQIPLQKMTIQP